MIEDSPHDQDPADMLSTDELLRALSRRMTAMVCAYRPMAENTPEGGYGGHLAFTGDTMLCYVLSERAYLDMKSLMDGMPVRLFGGELGSSGDHEDPAEFDDPADFDE